VIAVIAIIAVTSVSLADGYWHHRFRMGVADRVRVVNPVKPPAQPKPEAAEDVEQVAELKAVGT
jgi:hypothetical protein